MSAAIRIGARRSPLARAQANQVARLLADRGISSTFVGITTTGDVDRRALTEIGGTGVFATAVREALRAGQIDLAVHSLKDLPTAPIADLEVAAIPVREDTRDVLVGRRLAELDGGRIGTGAPRRALQLQDFAQRQGITISVVPVRGNVETRLRLVADGVIDAVVLAAAGLIRLGYLSPDPAGGGQSALSGTDTVVNGLTSQCLDYEVMLPAPGQGALALEIHSALSDRLAAEIRALDDPRSRAESLAERGFLAALQAGCTAPVGARAEVRSVRGKSFDLTLAAVIGKTLVSNLSAPITGGAPIRRKVHGSTEDPERFGADTAGKLLRELQDGQRSRRPPGEAEQRT